MFMMIMTALLSRLRLEAIKDKSERNRNPFLSKKEIGLGKLP